jgi:anti-sigma regulatory factor (Ser/Thr protein kinase)
MPSTALRHEALLYRGRAGWLAGVLDFIGPGLDAGDPVLVLADRSRIGALREQLGARGTGIELVDVHRYGSNPARLVPAWHELIGAHDGAARIWGVGEPMWPGRPPSEVAEVRQHEALVNLAFGDDGRVRFLCPYDVTALGPQAIRTARDTHEIVTTPSGPVERPAPLVRDPAAVLAEPLPEPAGRLPLRPYGRTGLGRLRRAVAEAGRDAGLDEARTRDLVLAVDEVATNCIRHGEGVAHVRSWREGGAAVVEIRDRGQVADPLAGRVRPTPGQLGGWGLWIANQVCDLVQLRTSAAGTVVRLHVRPHLGAGLP